MYLCVYFINVDVDIQFCILCVLISMYTHQHGEPRLRRNMILVVVALCLWEPSPNGPGRYWVTPGLEDYILPKSILGVVSLGDGR